MTLIFYTDQGTELTFYDVTIRAEDTNMIVFTQPSGSLLSPLYRQTSMMKTRFAGCTVDGLSIVPVALNASA